jgi:hypothetical protein
LVAYLNSKIGFRTFRFVGEAATLIPHSTPTKAPSFLEDQQWKKKLSMFCNNWLHISTSKIGLRSIQSLPFENSCSKKLSMFCNNWLHISTSKIGLRSIHFVGEAAALIPAQHQQRLLPFWKTNNRRKATGFL